MRKPGCAADPFEDEAKYPGVKIGARGSTVPVGSLYGYASGIIGLRLFPNPDFDEAAKAKWNADAYFKGDAKMVRPYRVGMSCGFCHVGPSPVHPPADPANPQFADLSSTVGAQYMWVDRLFIYRAQPATTTSSSSCTPIGLARWTPRWSPPTTSTIRGR